MLQREAKAENVVGGHFQEGLLGSYSGYRIQFSSVTQLCPTLCDPMDCSTPGFPVHYQLPELTQSHVHRVSDAIQPSHLLSSPYPPAFNLSQHQGFSNESVLHIRWPDFQFIGSLFFPKYFVFFNTKLYFFNFQNLGNEFQSRSQLC